MGLLLLIVLAMLLFSFAGYLICYLLFGSGKFWSQAEPARSRTAREGQDSYGWWCSDTFRPSVGRGARRKPATTAAVGRFRTFPPCLIRRQTEPGRNPAPGHWLGGW
jgi:hypothetical protein